MNLVFHSVGPQGHISYDDIAKIFHEYQGSIISNMGQAENFSIPMGKIKNKSRFFIFIYNNYWKV